MSRLIIALALMAWVSSTAQADNVYTLDFDATPVAGQFTTGGASTGVGFTNSAGVGGTNGAVISFDSSGFSTGLFADIDLFNNPGFLQKTPTSTSLSDYEFSFDAFATGFAPGVNSVFAQARFEFGPDVFVNNVTIPGGITDQVQTFTFGLDSDPSLTTVPAAFFGGGTAPRPTFQIQILGVENDFVDTSSTLVLDNFQITQVNSVPEPSSIAVILGFAGLALRRRRR